MLYTPYNRTMSVSVPLELTCTDPVETCLKDLNFPKAVVQYSSIFKMRKTQPCFLDKQKYSGTLSNLPSTNTSSLPRACSRFLAGIWPQSWQHEVTSYLFHKSVFVSLWPSLLGNNIAIEAIKSPTGVFDGEGPCRDWGGENSDRHGSSGTPVTPPPPACLLQSLFASCSLTPRHTVF